jgi:hypothetical protein
MKYIVIKSAGRGCPVIFPDILRHVDVFRALKAELGAELVSAGFTEISVGQAFGHSESLKVKARPEDLVLLQRAAALGPKVGV